MEVLGGICDARLLCIHWLILVLAGCFSGSTQGECSTWLVQATEVSIIPEPAPQYQSNAEEADARIWRHAKQSTANDILIYSPDTDIYNTGLGLIHTCTAKHSVKCAEISRTEVPTPQFTFFSTPE